jgi:hypothetical protein
MQSKPTLYASLAQHISTNLAVEDAFQYQRRLINLPVPHAKQKDILTSPAKRKVCCMGRRFGKTLYGSLEAVDDGQGGGALHGHKVLIASTSQDQSDVFWSYLKRWLQPLITSKSAYKNETKRVIELSTGGAIKVKTGRDADTLRGFDADKLILDECAFLDPSAWQEVGAPMLADRDGTAIFLSTPKRKNWFYVMYNRAIADTTGRWAAWHGTTFDNPHLSKQAVDELVMDMTEDGYRQEILAEFLEGSGQVFRHVDACATIKAPTRENPAEPYAGDFCMGVDTAQQQDYTVLTVMDRTTRQMVDLDRFNRVSWESYRQRIKTMFERWKPGVIEFEINSVGSPNFEALANDGLPVRAFETTAVSKPPLIESLILAFERKEITIFDDPVLVGELGAFERRVSASGRSQYSAPDGMHDDCVMSLALCWRNVIAGTGGRVAFIDW